jgi:hypothetical protein
MDKYPSDQSGTEARHKSKHTGAWVIAILLALAVGAFGLSAYMHRPTTGTVTEVSTTSITIQLSGSTSTKTFNIMKSTQMVLAQSGNSMQPQAFNASDIRMGETVVVSGTGSNHDQAQAIVVDQSR